MLRHPSLSCLLLGLLSCGIVHSQDKPQEMPREDVVHNSKVDDGELEVVSENFPQIRLLTMPQGKGF